MTPPRVGAANPVLVKVHFLEPLPFIGEAVAVKYFKFGIFDAVEKPESERFLGTIFGSQPGYFPVVEAV
jgi:hypothetical protein